MDIRYCENCGKNVIPIKRFNWSMFLFLCLTFIGGIWYLWWYIFKPKTICPLCGSDGLESSQTIINSKSIYSGCFIIFIIAFFSIAIINRIDMLNTKTTTDIKNSQITNQTPTMTNNKTENPQKSVSSPKTVSPQKPVSTPKTVKKLQYKKITYALLEEKIEDTKEQSSLIWHILVEGELSKQNLKDFLSKLYSSAIKKPLKHHKALSEIYIYTYISQKKQTENLWLACVEKTKNNKPIIKYNNVEYKNYQYALASGTIETKVVLPNYSILDEEIYDVPLKTQVTLSILVFGEITEEGLKIVLNNLYSQTMQRKEFKYYNPPTHIQIGAYTSKERAESGMGQWIALLNKMGKDDKPEIRINERQIALLNAKPEHKLGYSEKERIKIFQELVKAEDRAYDEAMQKYPSNLDKQMDFARVLEEKYDNEVSKKYGLTNEQLTEILVEATTKDWPYPNY